MQSFGTFSYLPLPVQIFSGNRFDRAFFSWSSGLTLARVTHWGGMISTPDVVLQTEIKAALNESACPTEIIEQLMENAHERHWPQGLSSLGRRAFFTPPIRFALVFCFSLETRQENRQYYESYVCRRIAGKQAVVILSCDNRHMNSSMSE